MEKSKVDSKLPILGLFESLNFQLKVERDYLFKRRKAVQWDYLKV